jgi:NADH-quinone oxidoreductase subunit F
MIGAGTITSIIAYQGSCGIAAGAEKLYQEVLAQLPEISIKKVGCLGLCHQEPMLQLMTNEGIFVYGRLRPQELKNIFSTHREGGEASPKLIYASTRQENSAWKFFEAQKRIALRHVGVVDPISISNYQELGGYASFRRILQEKIPPQQIINWVKESGLRGRGGAGFLTGAKWQFAFATQDKKKYLICNGDEGDPGAFMDRSILEGDPHSVLEGMLIAAYAIGANYGYAYIRAEYPLAVLHFEKAIADAYHLGLLGKNILNRGHSFDLKVKQGAGAFVCGEETALIASIEGERGMPRKRPPFPAVKGLWNHPTVINNVETLANIPWILTHGPAAFNGLGTEKSKGTKVFALAGAIQRGGLVEVPMGASLSQVLEIGGGSKSGRPIKAVQLGGPSGGCIPRDYFHLPVDYEAIASTGAIMGSGGMIVLDEATCMVDLARYFLEFTQKESCGKCTFCRVGTRRMREILIRICEGLGKMEDLQLLETLAQEVKATSLCGLGQSAPNPVLTTLRYFRSEYVAHIELKKCPAGVCTQLIRFSITPEKCVACDLCRKACPITAIEGTLKERGSYSILQEKCIRCGMCREACRLQAIKVE